MSGAGRKHRAKQTAAEEPAVAASASESGRGLIVNFADAADVAAPIAIPAKFHR